ncbi:hypothetical protein FGB62_237g06 [Gracilaria domingensis]|nr:hypothetical protein FGB62_237g06 [Gracilaria domingensis]
MSSLPRSSEPYLTGCITSIVRGCRLPPSVAEVARVIYYSTLNTLPNRQTVASAVYLAMHDISYNNIPEWPLSFRLILAEADIYFADLYVTEDGRLTCEDDLESTLVPSLPPCRAIYPKNYKGFMISAHVWCQFDFLVSQDFFHHHLLLRKAVWLLFLVVKNSMSLETDRGLNRWHRDTFLLLLSCLVESGFVAAADPVHAISQAAGVKPSEIQYFRSQFEDRLSNDLLSGLPLLTSNEIGLGYNCLALGWAYGQVIEDRDHPERRCFDERVFLFSQRTAHTTNPLRSVLDRSLFSFFTRGPNQSYRRVLRNLSTRLRRFIRFST